MVPFIPPEAATILDVGCSRGLFGATLRRANPGWRLVGIEPDPDTAAGADAGSSYERVICGSFPDDLPDAENFDCIVFNDVLEHVIDPWDMLRRTQDHLAVGGVVVASIPNVRFVAVVRDLLLRGRWDYADYGVLDRTHLRFFTRRSIYDLFASSGFTVDSLTPINPLTVRWASLLIGRFRDMRYLQFAVVAHRAGSADS